MRSAGRLSRARRSSGCRAGTRESLPVGPVSSPDGFKAHLVAELITGCALTRASGPDTGDAAVGIGLLAADDSLPTPTVQVLADSAYGTGSMLAALATTGHIPVIKPSPVHSLIPG